MKRRYYKPRFVSRLSAKATFGGSFRLRGMTPCPTFRIYAGQLDDDNHFSAKAELMNPRKYPSMTYIIEGYFDPETGNVDLVLDIPRVSGNANVGGLIETIRITVDEEGRPIWGMTTIVVPQAFKGRLTLTFEESEDDPGQDWSRVWQGEIPCLNPTPRSSHFLLDDSDTVEIQLNELKC